MKADLVSKMITLLTRPAAHAAGSVEVEKPTAAVAAPVPMNVSNPLSGPYPTGSYLIPDIPPGKERESEHFRNAMTLHPQPYRASGSHQLNLQQFRDNADASGENIANGLGTVTSLGYNLSGDNGSGYLTVTGDQINIANPMLGPLQDDGGPTFTHELLTGSAAIDKGKNVSAATTDQRGPGFARTVDNPSITNATGGDGTDIGAFEVQATNTVCPQPQGYWKNNPNAWPSSALPMTLGSQSYTKPQLLTVLNTPVGGDASLILANQLIAAKLNIANGADGSPVTSTITDADAVLSLYSGKLPYKVRPNTTNGQRMVNDGAILESFNKGMLTPDCSQ